MTSRGPDQLHKSPRERAEEEVYAQMRNLMVDVCSQVWQVQPDAKAGQITSWTISVKGGSKLRVHCIYDTANGFMIQQVREVTYGRDNLFPSLIGRNPATPNVYQELAKAVTGIVTPISSSTPPPNSHSATQPSIGTPSNISEPNTQVIAPSGFKLASIEPSPDATQPNVVIITCEYDSLPKYKVYCTRETNAGVAVLTVAKVSCMEVDGEKDHRTLTAEFGKKSYEMYKDEIGKRILTIEGKIVTINIDPPLGFAVINGTVEHPTPREYVINLIHADSGQKYRIYCEGEKAEKISVIKIAKIEGDGTEATDDYFKRFGAKRLTNELMTEIGYRLNLKITRGEIPPELTKEKLVEHFEILTKKDLPISQVTLNNDGTATIFVVYEKIMFAIGVIPTEGKPAEYLRAKLWPAYRISRITRNDRAIRTQSVNQDLTGSIELLHEELKTTANTIKHNNLIRKKNTLALASILGIVGTCGMGILGANALYHYDERPTTDASVSISHRSPRSTKNRTAHRRTSTTIVGQGQNHIPISLLSVDSGIADTGRVDAGSRGTDIALDSGNDTRTPDRGTDVALDSGNDTRTADRGTNQRGFDGGIPAQTRVLGTTSTDSGSDIVPSDIHHVPTTEIPETPDGGIPHTAPTVPQTQEPTVVPPPTPYTTETHNGTHYVQPQGINANPEGGLIGALLDSGMSLHEAERIAHLANPAMMQARAARVHLARLGTDAEARDLFSHRRMGARTNWQSGHEDILSVDWSVGPDGVTHMNIADNTHDGQLLWSTTTTVPPAHHSLATPGHDVHPTAHGVTRGHVHTRILGDNGQGHQENILQPQAQLEQNPEQVEVTETTDLHVRDAFTRALENAAEVDRALAFLQVGQNRATATIRPTLARTVAPQEIIRPTTQPVVTQQPSIVRRASNWVRSLFSPSKQEPDRYIDHREYAESIASLDHYYGIATDDRYTQDIGPRQVAIQPTKPVVTQQPSIVRRASNWVRSLFSPSKQEPDRYIDHREYAESIASLDHYYGIATDDRYTQNVDPRSVTSPNHRSERHVARQESRSWWTGVSSWIGNFFGSSEESDRYINDDALAEKIASLDRHYGIDENQYVDPLSTRATKKSTWWDSLSSWWS